MSQFILGNIMVTYSLMDVKDTQRFLWDVFNESIPHLRQSKNGFGEIINRLFGTIDSKDFKWFKARMNYGYINARGHYIKDGWKLVLMGELYKLPTPPNFSVRFRAIVTNTIIKNKNIANHNYWGDFSADTINVHNVSDIMTFCNSTVTAPYKPDTIAMYTHYQFDFLENFKKQFEYLKSQQSKFN